MTLQERTYRYFPVTHIVGSLPGGGTVPNTPVYAVKGLGGTFDRQYMPPKEAFHEIDLKGQLAFYIDDVALPHETATLIVRLMVQTSVFRRKNFSLTVRNDVF